MKTKLHSAYCELKHTNAFVFFTAKHSPVFDLRGYPPVRESHHVSETEREKRNNHLQTQRTGG